jgi:hypothetical protein
MEASRTSGNEKSLHYAAVDRIEVLQVADGSIVLGDPTDSSRPPHCFTREEWTEFLRGVKAGEFDFGPPRDFFVVPPA